MLGNWLRRLFRPDPEREVKTAQNISAARTAVAQARRVIARMERVRFVVAEDARRADEELKR